MPTMSRIEAAFCRSAPWRFTARRLVLPWALQGATPRGEVLEIGAGSGAMAAELLAMHPEIRMTVTDFDPAMVDAATARLASFQPRVTARQADATKLDFDDDSFDLVLSWIMLHHTVEWEQALAEAVRVVRPGGRVIGYDLLDTAPLRALHRVEGARFRMMRMAELRNAVGGLELRDSALRPTFAGIAVRFVLQKT